MMDCKRLFSSARFLLATGFAAAIITGCGGAPEDAPKRFDISGEVTYDGKPVPAGRITFTNDETLYATSCTIEDGYYENQSDKGHTGGTFTVTVSGFSSLPEGALPGVRLWKTDWIKQGVTLPAESTTMNFDVPTSEVEPDPNAGGDPLEQT